jgi:NADH:ubiquinone oxidoreductase subunit 3 (subunit A)
MPSKPLKGDLTKKKMLEYGTIIIFTIISAIIAGILVGLSYLFSNKNPDAEKVSTYECGFAPFSDSRKQFEVRFFLVGILFIIFDLEISFLFPWSIVLLNLEVLGYWTMYTFLFILTIGLVYEWNRGGLEWE